MINREKARAYESIRLSGATDMSNIERVCELSGYTLTRKDCLEIMKNYEEIMGKYKIRSFTYARK